MATPKNKEGAPGPSTPNRKARRSNASTATTTPRSSTRKKRSAIGDDYVTTSSTSTSTATTTSTPTPNKLGRPNKQDTPADFGTKKVAAATAATTETTPKKRGRPRKQATPIVEETETTTADKTTPTSSKKRGRTPKKSLTKTTTTTMSPKKPSGSSKKKNPTPKKNKDGVDDEETLLPTTPPTVESSCTKRRKRKMVITTPTIATPVSPSTKSNNNRSEPATSEEKRKKRKPKRPKKDEINALAVIEENVDAAMDVVTEENALSVVAVAKQKNHLSNSQPAPKKEYPPTLDARVHRLRHMGYIPGSVSALTAQSTKDGQVVVGRTDGSYELKSITIPPNAAAATSSSVSYYSDNISAPTHRLITIAETSPITGRKAASEGESDDDSEEDGGNDRQPETCPDAASSLCWVYPSSSSTTTPVCVGSGPNGNIWIVDFKKSGPIDITSSGGGGIFDLTTCSGDTSSPLPFVAAACEDGSVRIWRIGSSSSSSSGRQRNQIQDPPLVTLPSAGAPVLSLVWKRVTVLKQGKTTTFQTVVFASIADGTIRKYGLDIEELSTNIENDDGEEEESYFYSVPNTPKSILRMTIENKGRKDPTKVWTLLLLRDNSLVAGNSLGQVQFWNGETGTLTQTVIQSTSQADVLKMVVNSDETKLFCSGVDSKVVCLERKKTPITATTSPTQQSNDLTALVTSHLTAYRPWKMTISQRPHTHDVKAMAIVMTSSSNALSSTSTAAATETLLTGGVDTKICSYSVSTFAHTQPQTWYPWPSATSLFSSTTCAPKGRPKLVSMQRHDRVELYQLEALKTYKAQQPKWNSSKETGSSKKDSVVGMKLLAAQESHRAVLAQHPTSIPVGTIRLGGIDDDGSSDDMMPSSTSSSPLQASLLSPNGKFLAVSNANSTYVFHLEHLAGETNDDGSVRLQPAKLELPAKLQNVSATAFLFVGDDLYVGDSSGHQKVHVVRLRSGAGEANTTEIKETEEDSMDVDCDDTSGEMSMQTISLPESQHLNNNNGEIDLPIQSLHASDNYGEYLVTMSHARENAVHIFRRSDSNAPYEHFWTLPSLGVGTDGRPAAVTVLAGNRLAVATYRSHLYLFDMETKSLNEWSEQYGFPIKDKKWTEDSLCGRGYPLRLIPQENERLIMASFGTFCVIDLSTRLPRRCRTVPKRPVWKNRRKYKPIVHDDDDNEDDDDNDDHWLEPRVTKVVEDEYLHNDPDADDDDDTTVTKQPSTLKVIPVPHEIPDEELVARSCTICSHYKNMLYADFLGPKEMLVVEQPWLEVAETFPAALQRRIYGAD